MDQHGSLRGLPLGLTPLRGLRCSFPGSAGKPAPPIRVDRVDWSVVQKSWLSEETCTTDRGG